MKKNKRKRVRGEKYSADANEEGLKRASVGVKELGQ